MKVLILFALLFTIPLYLKAQDATLGKSKEQIRALIKPNGGIILLKGNDCDTLTLQGGLKTFMYYKDDVCYASKSIIPLKYLTMIVEKMTTDSYKKVGENEWVNHSETVKVNITILKTEDQFIVETSQLNIDKKSL